MILIKNIFKYIGFFCLIVICFYYTDKVALIVRNKNPLIQEIMSVSKQYEVAPIDCYIKGDTIIPGLNGLEVNTVKSFNAMKKINEFDELYFIFNQVLPNNSLEDNKDKIIVQGNKDKDSVSIILKKPNSYLEKYLVENEIMYDVVINEKVKELSEAEYLNGAINDFDLIENYLNGLRINKNICIIDNNQELCLENHKYLVIPNLNLTNSNIAIVKSKILSGSIILIDDNVSLNILKIFIDQIKYQNLKIVYLSDLISEIRS